MIERDEPAVAESVFPLWDVFWKNVSVDVDLEHQLHSIGKSRYLDGGEDFAHRTGRYAVQIANASGKQ